LQLSSHELKLFSLLWMWSSGPGLQLVELWDQLVELGLFVQVEKMRVQQNQGQLKHGQQELGLLGQEER
ncbi:hypothetical protein U1Q18_049033, partial [Sarracenia purpurea var. burkii]